MEIKSIFDKIRNKDSNVKQTDINIDVQLIEKLNVDNVSWCDEAILFCVKNGKGTLTNLSAKTNEPDDCFYSQLLFDGKPIIQGKLSYCPTCSGMLATGYGIENIKSPELIKVSECLNSEYRGIEKSFEAIKPLLGLLDDGYYLLADTRLFPADGMGNFFYSVPNELTYNESATDYYYNSDLMGTAQGFPAFIYPTQSADLINEERVDEYAKIISGTDNPPRGLAYYDFGFICTLLDGHHKACASSMLGKRFNCLTIVKARYSFYPGSTYPDRISFPDIKIDEKFDIDKKIYSGQNKMSLLHSLPLYHLTGRKFPDKYIGNYPTVKVVAASRIAIIDLDYDIDSDGDILELANSFIENYSEENMYRLECIFYYFYGTEIGFSLAKMVFKNKLISKKILICAIKELLRHPCEETDELMVDYYLNHNSKDECMDLVNSYLSSRE